MVFCLTYSCSINLCPGWIEKNLVLFQIEISMVQMFPWKRQIEVSNVIIVKASVNIFEGLHKILWMLQFMNHQLRKESCTSLLMEGHRLSPPKGLTQTSRTAFLVETRRVILTQLLRLNTYDCFSSINRYILTHILEHIPYRWQCTFLKPKSNDAEFRVIGLQS